MGQININNINDGDIVESGVPGVRYSYNAQTKSFEKEVKPVTVGSGGEIVKVTEGNNTGYAFADDDRSAKNPIGNKAIDFSFYDDRYLSLAM